MLSVKVFLNYKLIVISRILWHPIHPSLSLVAKSCPTLSTPWTVAHQAPLSMEFSRHEYWSGLPFPSPGIFPTQESNPGLLHCRQILYWLSYEGSLWIIPFPLRVTMMRCHTTCDITLCDMSNGRVACRARPNQVSPLKAEHLLYFRRERQRSG